MPREPLALLLVEGPDDQHTLWSLLGAHDFPQAFEVKASGNDDKARAEFETRLAAQNQRRLGLVIDADDHLDRRWQSVRQLLVDTGYAPPELPDPNGTVIASPTPPQEGDTQFKPRVGVWIMPDNRVPGTLEDFLARLIPDGDPNWPHAQKAVGELPQRPDPANDAWHSKARMHTWLAWQEEPGRPYGQAITATYLRYDAPQVDALVGWLRRLFIDE